MGSPPAQPNPHPLSYLAKLEQQAAWENPPSDLAELLDSLSLSKFLPTFEEQDVDLQVFLSLTDNDLKEVGIK